MQMYDIIIENNILLINSVQTKKHPALACV